MRARYKSQYKSGHKTLPLIYYSVYNMRKTKTFFFNVSYTIFISAYKVSFCIYKKKTLVVYIVILL